LCLKRSWSDFDPQAYTLYGEDQDHETSFKGKALQSVVDSWCKIQVVHFIFLLKTFQLFHEAYRYMPNFLYIETQLM
jgi:hypothetical protein